MASKNKLPVDKKSTVISNSTTSNASPMKRDNEAEERKYKAKYALEDIERAEAHKCDKALMKDVKSLAREKIKSLSKLK